VCIRTKWIDPPDGESYEILQRVEWPAEMTLTQAKAALADIDAAMAPADDRSLGALLLELWLSTAKQGIATEDQQALARVYITELKAWPADIALSVLRRAKREVRWWPPLADLVRECCALARVRMWLRCSLEDHLAQMEQPSPAAPAFAALPPMPGSEKAKAPRSPASFWSPRSGNVERLAQHLGCSPRQARERLLFASADDLQAFEQAVRENL
jgi:hypothetical protein